MGTIRLCAPPKASNCPERFRIQGSNWIDGQNVGDRTQTAVVPGGIRLKWNAPFIYSGSSIARYYPNSYTVMRSDGISMRDDRLFSPKTVTVGHPPRSLYPDQFWGSLDRLDPLTFVYKPDSECSSFDAVYFEVAGIADSTTVTLNGIDGRAKVTARVRSGDVFYFERSGLKSVVFSAPVKLERIGFLRFPPVDDLDEYLNLNFIEVANIDARAWINHDLSDISKRTSLENGGAFVHITKDQWEDLQARGENVLNSPSIAHADPSDLSALRLLTSLSWETSTLLGQGFLDGIHDKIDDDDYKQESLLNGIDNKSYGYYVIAKYLDTEGNEATETSFPVFSSNVHMAQLGEIECSQVGSIWTSRRRIQSGNLSDFKRIAESVETVKKVETIDEVTNDGDTPIKEIDEYLNNVTFELTSSLPATELVIVEPMATDSSLISAKFERCGESISPDSTEPLEVKGLDIIQRRHFEFPVPFYDSEIFSKLTAGDTWDRRKKVGDSDKVRPEIRYKESCVAFKNIHISRERNEIAYELNSVDWKADKFAQAAQGELQFLIKHPDRLVTNLDVTVDGKKLDIDNVWRVTLTAALPISDELLDGLVGGTLNVGSFYATITEVARLSRESIRCGFETQFECGSARVFSDSETRGVVTENPNAKRFWLVFHRSDILADGSIGSYSSKRNLVECETEWNKGISGDEDKLTLDYTRHLTFATRLHVDYLKLSYKGQVSNPLDTIYVQPPPKAPDFCFKADQLGTDYYGRTIVRISAENCDAFDDRYAVKVTLAPAIADSTADFTKSEVAGEFGAQQPLRGSSYFEILPQTNLKEGSNARIGVRYVRLEDETESEPLVREFEVRKV